MRNISLSQYLSKSLHVFTSFVYLFTFLGPSLALATRTETYTETLLEHEVYNDSYLAPPTASSAFVPNSGRHFQDQQDSQQNHPDTEQINISRGWGEQSLFFGVGQVVQHLISPPILSEGNLPYEEVVEEGISLGFQGNIPRIGDFFCSWDGALLLQGNHLMNLIRIDKGQLF